MPDRDDRRRSNGQGRARPGADLTAPHTPEPTEGPLTYRGEQITPGLIIRLHRHGQGMMRESRNRILEARQFRRMAEDSMVRLAPEWVRLHPEAAEWVVECLEERVTLDSNMIARSGAVEPDFIREPLGFLQRDHEAAEGLESYLNEWKAEGVPFQSFIGKGTEDGQYARVTLPAHLDMDGAPDFFETLDERAYELLDDDAKKTYDEDDDYSARQLRRSGRVKRKKYIKVEERDGRRVKKVNPKYDKGDTDKSKEAHKEAISRYLLDKQASNTRLIPALDCAPIFDRGRGRERFELAALVERTLFYKEELLEQEYGWKGMGERRLLPRAYNADGSAMSIRPEEVGKSGQFYLYTAYLVCKDEDGHRRPVLAYTVGGSGTVLGSDREPEDPNAIGLIDLFAETQYTDERGRTCGLEGPLWSYHGGLHGEDDDPDHFWRPYIYPFIKRIRSIEGKKTSMNATIEEVAFTGHTYKPDAALAEHAPDAVTETDGSLIRPTVPGPGEIIPAAGDITPFQQARIGMDAWQGLASDMQALQQATMIDQLPGGDGQSGHAMLVQSTLGQVGKRQIREGALDALVRSGQDHLRIVDALYRKYDVCWPLQTIQERPVGEETRTGYTPVEYDPEWVGEGQFKLKAEYPEEENLARIDLEASLADRGYGNVDRVHRAMGEPDSDRARLKADRDRLMKLPQIDLLRLERVAKKLGDRDMQKLLQLQAQQQMSKASVPGLEGGIPAAALKRQATGGEGAAGGSTASSIRGGVQAAQVGGDRLAADAQVAATQNGTGTAA